MSPREVSCVRLLLLADTNESNLYIPEDICEPGEGPDPTEFVVVDLAASSLGVLEICGDCTLEAGFDAACSGVRD